MKNLLLSLLSASLLLAAATAKADTLTITLTEPYQSISSGVVAFDATVTNDTGATVYLNGDDFNLDAPLTLDDSPYDNNFPFTLAPGASASGELFDVDVPADTLGGLYTGSFEITGGSDGNADNVVGTADFDVQVTPEPSSFLLLATGIAGIGGTLRSRIARKRTSKARN